MTSIRDRNGNKTTFSGAVTHTTPFTCHVPAGDPPHADLVTQTKYTITDSNNRDTTVTSDYSVDGSCSTYPVTDTIVYPGSGGTPRSIVVSFNTLNHALRTDLAGTTPAHCLVGQDASMNLVYADIAGISTIDALFPEGATSGTTRCHNPYVVTSVMLPNGVLYGLRYNQYAELAEVDLPTGGRYEYDNQSGNSTVSGVMSSTGQPGLGGVAPYMLNRRVAKRRVFRDASTKESETSFPVAPVTTSTSGYANDATTPVTVTVVDNGGITLESTQHSYYGGPFSSLAAWQFYPNWNEGKEFQTISLDPSKDANHQPVRTVINTWQQRGAGTTSVTPASGGVTTTAADNPRITQTDTRLNDTGSDLAAPEPDGSHKPDPATQLISRKTFAYDQYNNVVTAKDYDFGTGGPGALLREVDTTYKPDAAYFSPTGGIYLPSLPLTETVTDGATNFGKTTFEYDTYAGTNRCALTGRTGAQMDSGFGTSQTFRGNVTMVDQWLNTPGSSDIITYSCYDTAGNPTKKVDGRGIATTFKYDQDATSAHSEAYPFAHLTGLTRDIFTVTMGWDSGSDRMTSVKDPNSNTTSYDHTDPLDRLKTVTFPDGGSTGYQYTDATFPNKVQTTSKITSTTDPNCTAGLSRFSTISYDGLGRVSQAQQTDPQGDTFVDTTYDGMGRVYQVSNPYRSGGSVKYTTTTYDILGRPSAKTTADSANSIFTYTGNITSIKNPRLNTKSQAVDGLGRLTKVTEEDGTIAYYGYDPLGDLLSVIHDDPDPANCTAATPNARARCFTYDSLKRLKTALNSETGSIGYTYDENSNLKTKTAKSGVITTLTYDNIDRPITKSYTGATNTPNIGYGYDTATNGQTRLGSVTATLGTQSYATTYSSYDSMGRVTASIQAMPGNANYTFSYLYNLAGGLELETYPRGTRKVKSCYDSVGRISAVSNPTANTPYATVDATTGYTSFGAIRKLTLGNNVVESALFDSTDGVSENNTRLQLTHKTVVDGGGTQLLGLKYGYCSGVLTGCTTNNGNVMSQAISPTNAITFSQTFGYDQLDRLTYANEGNRDTVNLGWSESYAFKWSNKYTSGRTGSLPTLTNLTPSVATAFNTANQVISGPPNNIWSYDLDGNLTRAGSGPMMAYDGENRLVSSTPASGTPSTYVYDGLGHRVQAVTPDPQSSTATITTTFVYDAMGNLAAEYASSSTAVNGTTYLTDDALGSTRLVTNLTGVPQARYDYLPFGEEIWGGSNGRSSIPGYGVASVRQKFTGKERDAETGLDYFGARYYGGAQGRWTSPDWSASPEPVPYADFSDPQTLNLYGYVRNNPLRATDPDGHSLWAIIKCTFGSCEDRANERIDEYAQNHKPKGRDKVYTADEVKAMMVGTDEKGKRRAFTAEETITAIDILEGRVKVQPMDVPPPAVSVIEPFHLDQHGRIHQELPDRIPDNWTPGQLKEARDVLKQSIENRIKEGPKFGGPDARHALRIRQEQQLLRQVEGKLGSK